MDEPRPYAVVTGGSSGIGKEIVRELVTRGYDVLAVAEEVDITTSAQEIGPAVEPAQIDLATYDGVEELTRRIEESGRHVDVAVLNAGVSVSGAFASGTSLDEELNLIALNVTSTVHLAKRLVPAMVNRNAGHLLFTASIAAAIPGPYTAVYSASKAFVYSFAQGLRTELEDTDVVITALMPGPTHTEIFERSGAMDTKLGETARKDDPEVVAKEGLDALFAGKDHVIPGTFLNKLQAAASQILPDKAMAKLHSTQSAPGTAD